MAVSLPVVMKGARGAENTLTANVSAHGLAVFTDTPLALRQYVELELKLPPDGQSISVTGVVTRIIGQLEDPAGLLHPGVAFDFYLFDQHGRSAWRAFLERLERGAPAALVTSAPPPPLASPALARSGSETVDSGATFLIKPRDVGRLWSFFRGELGSGRVRIETPILKPIGTPVEVVVIHPETQEEWALPGKVSTASEHGRGRGPMLEITLGDVDENKRLAFRRFITSGRVTDAGEPAMIGAAAEPPPTNGASQHAPSAAALTGDLSIPAPPAPNSEALAPAAIPERKSLPLSSPDRKTLDAPAERRTIEPPPPGSLPPPPPLLQRRSQDAPARPSAGPLSGLPPPPARVSAPARASMPAPPRPSIAPPPPASVAPPPAAPIGAGASAAGTPFAAFFAEYETHRPSSVPPAAGDGETSLADEAGFDDVETSREAGVMPLLAPERPPEPPRVAGDHLRPVRQAAREGAGGLHRSLSTAGIDPALDREIALARARLVRTPESVTACYQLGKLLLRRGSPDSLEEATAQLSRAVTLEPNHPGAHLAAAELAVKQGNFETAAEHLQRARRLGYRIDERLEKLVSSGKAQTK